MHAVENTYELILLVGGYKYLKRGKTGWKFVNLRNFRNFNKILESFESFLENFAKILKKFENNFRKF